MKTCLLFMVLSAGSLLSGAEPTQQPASTPLAGTPEEITQFYQDVNFAACFSTLKERALVSHMIQTQATDKLPSRLQKVAQAVQRIRKASASIDPQMVHDAGTWTLPAEELTEISAMQRTGDRMVVEVNIRSVSAETRSWLVAQFDHPTETKAAEVGSVGLAAVLKQTARKETQVWQLVQGRWVRNEAGIVLLKVGK